MRVIGALMTENFKYKCTLTCTMTIKSLTITEDAYETLKRIKSGNESFSDVILRLGKTQANVVEKYFGILKGTEKDAENWEKRIREERTKADNAFSQKQKKNMGLFAMIMTFLCFE